MPVDQVVGKVDKVEDELVRDIPQQPESRKRTKPFPEGLRSAIQYLLPLSKAAGGTSNAFHFPELGLANTACVSKVAGLLPELLV